MYGFWLAFTVLLDVIVLIYLLYDGIKEDNSLYKKADNHYMKDMWDYE